VTLATLLARLVDLSICDYGGGQSRVRKIISYSSNGTCGYYVQATTAPLGREHVSWKLHHLHSSTIIVLLVFRLVDDHCITVIFLLTFGKPLFQTPEERSRALGSGRRN